MADLTQQDIEGLQRVRAYCKPIAGYLPSVLSHRVSVNTLAEYVPTNNIVIAGGFMADAFRDEVATTKDVDVFMLNCVPGEKIPEDWRITREQIENLGDATLGSYNPNASQFNVVVGRPPEILESMITKYIYPATVNNNDVGRSRAIPINIISTTYKTRKELIDHFDMAQCQMHYALDYKDNTWKVFATRKTLDLIHKKQIAMSKTNFGALKAWRVERYTSRGWTHSVPSV